MSCCCVLRMTLRDDSRTAPTQFHHQCRIPFADCSEPNIGLVALFYSQLMLVDDCLLWDILSYKYGTFYH